MLLCHYIYCLLNLIVYYYYFSYYYTCMYFHVLYLLSSAVLSNHRFSFHDVRLLLEGPGSEQPTRANIIAVGQWYQPMMNDDKSRANKWPRKHTMFPISWRFRFQKSLISFNMILNCKAMEWLVDGSRSGDSLFFHYRLFMFFFFNAKLSRKRKTWKHVPDKWLKYKIVLVFF